MEFFNRPITEAAHSENDHDDHLNHFLIDRRKKRREKIIAAAINQGGTLTPEAQDALVKQHLADGWGRLAHGVTRQLKAPTRYGLKLVDVAIILTIYDRTIAQVVPKMFAPITVDEFEIETGMDGSNLRATLRELIKKSILVKTSYKTLNFWGLNHAYFDRQKEVPSPRVKETQGPSPQGNAPCDKQGDSPCVKVGQTNPPPAASSPLGASKSH